MLEKLPDVVGHALRNQRAGLDQIAFHQTPLREGLGAIEVASLAFADHAPIPARYTADGEGVSPPLHWSGLPTATQSVVLIVEDADAPTPQPLVHAIAVGLAPEETALAEAALGGADAQPVVQVGRHSLLGSGWLPPDPPPGHGTHRYAFQVFALREPPAFSDTPGREELLEALAAHAIAAGLLVGTYERPDGRERADDPGPALTGIAAPQ